MPESINVTEFVREAWDDYNSPTTSTFVSKMVQCKNTVSSLEETLDYDRSGLTKMKKSVKALYSTGNMQVNNEAYLADNLKKLSQCSLHRDNEADIGEAFHKFSVVTMELSGLMKNLMQNISNILMFPLDSLLKGDLKGVKGDLKKPFDKAWKDYENKSNKIEKEKKQVAKEAGLIKTEVTGPEIAEEMEKERRVFQLQMCEYLIKVNEIKTKKGIDLLQNLVKYYQAQSNYFQDGLKTIEHFRCYIEELVTQLNQIKQWQDKERWELIELRDVLKSTLTTYGQVHHLGPSHSVSNNYSQHRLSTASSNASGYSLHQLQGNKAHGYERCGNLLKKSEGKMRKVWQKRKCVVKDGCLSISHSDITKEPVRLNLLTCQVKLVPEDTTKKCFDLMSSSTNRTYHFQADDTHNMEVWISVLNNAKEAVLLKAFGESAGPDSSHINQSVKELTSTIIQEVRRLPGNGNCCDCGAPDPEWLSVNLGVLVCLECCGVHREMGVHISRTQSIVIDDLGTSQLLLARAVGNRTFNDILEATLDPKCKPTPTSPMDEKKAFIRSKYEKKRYAIMTCSNVEDRKQDLKLAVLTRDISALLQVYAEGMDFMEPLPEMENDETALHLAIMEEDEGSSLHMFDFLLQNSNSQQLRRPLADGSNALHLCAELGQTECMKLLLRVQPELITQENAEGRTALEIARDKGHDICVDLLNHAISGKSELFENVNVDWDLNQEDYLFDNVDYSDDELDITERRARSRPGSLVLPYESSMPLVNMTHRERSRTEEINLRVTTLPPPPPPNKPKATPQHTAGSGTGTLSHSQAAVSLAAVLNSNSLSGSINNLATGNAVGLGGTLLRRKPPAPPPPTSRLASQPRGHLRNPSDPGILRTTAHVRSPSDPPPLPVKTSAAAKHMAGAHLVLPPPPQFSSTVHGDSSSKPVPVPRMPRRSGVPETQPATAPKKPSVPDPVDALNANDPTPAGTGSVSSNNSHSNNSANNNLNGGSRSHSSSERLDSTDSSSSERLDSNPNPSTPRAKPGLMRCRALYKCEADNEDELSFDPGETIVVVKEEEEEWWEGHIEGQPERRGMFPTTFVRQLTE